MKRLIYWLPYVGLALLALALFVRALRTEGLDLPEFPRPPVVELPRENLASGANTLAGRVVDHAASPVAEALVIAGFDGEITWDYTDEQGYFSIERLPVTECDLSILARKFTTKQVAAQVDGTELLIDIGQPVPPPPSLPELGESDLQGQVIAAVAGRGLLGYELQLVPVAPPETFSAPVPVRTEVGADRTFSFPALLHGEYEVRVLPPWARGGSWPNLAAPEARVFVHGPAQKRLEVAMSAGEIAGRLIDGAGEFIEGAVVLVEPANDRARPWIPAHSSKTGSFLVRDLPPGSYRLLVASGKARVDEIVEVLSGVTSEVDLPPMGARGQ